MVHAPSHWVATSITKMIADDAISTKTAIMSICWVRGGRWAGPVVGPGVVGGSAGFEGLVGGAWPVRLGLGGVDVLGRRLGHGLHLLGHVGWLIGGWQ